MVRSQGLRGDPSRQGVVLLVVISLLVLFSLVGLAFVVYAEGQANVARLWREAETSQQPNMDPELLLSYFLGQFIYDTDNLHSAMRGHSLARNMYGANPAGGNVIPYTGVGRVHGPGPGGQDSANLVNYTWFGSDGFLRDPETTGQRSGPQQPPGTYVCGSVSYTYPDANNLYLAAQQASDGRLLTQSFHRNWLFNPTQALNDAGNPNWTNSHGKYLTMRPRPADHSPAFPMPADAGGDVRNLADSPGYFDPITGAFCANDSIWMDLGFPVMTGPDGRKFKPLFAPLVLDLDNRVNVNMHGNKFGTWNVQSGGSLPDRTTYWSASENGWGPWEVNLGKVMTARTGGGAEWEGEWRYLLLGRDGVQGRYDPNFWMFAPPATKLPSIDYRIIGKFYSMVNENSHIPGKGNTGLPGMPAQPWGNGWTSSASCPATSCFRHDSTHYGRDNFIAGGADSPYPTFYNFWDTTGWNTFAPGARDKRFAISNLEAVLRYGDVGSPSMTSDLFKLCPQSFADPKTRKLVTTHAFDIDRPGVMPGVWDPLAQPFQLATGQRQPTGGAMAFPGIGQPAPADSEFTQDWRSRAAPPGRIDLDRKLPVYGAGYTQAVQARQSLAKEIFDCARVVTGAADPLTATSPEDVGALRWLAQLSANIVDFVDEDDFMTPFQWKQGQWVFGSELPRLVINEVYAEVGNDAAEPAASPRATRDYQVKFWAELHNPTYRNTMQSWSQSALSENCAARLRTANGQPVYQLVIAKDQQPDQPLPDLRRPDNTLGVAELSNPNHNASSIVKAVVTDWTSDPANAGGVDVNIVQALPAIGRTTGPDAGNEGFYLAGPRDDFPGGAAAKPKATSKVRDTAASGTTARSAMACALETASLPGQLPTYTLLLRRLACPTQAHQPDPAQPNYNPFVTVDYFENVSVNDAVEKDSGGNHAGRVADVAQRFSLGRNQPYAADKKHFKSQRNAAGPLTDQPQHTFFKINHQPTNPFDWLMFADRPPLSGMEILQVSGWKPHELTQQFMTGDIDPATGKAQQRHNHRAPWFDSSARIYRLLEFLVGGLRLQGMAVGARTVGKVNINTIWDVETLRALADARPANYFLETDVDAVFAALKQSRSPGNAPGPNDRPFLGMAAPYLSAGQQYPAGAGIEDTLLRPSPVNPGKRLFEPANLPATANNHPLLQHEMLTKMYDQLTTRSNVFAVWLTVGFFEVVDDSDATRPPRLGAEIGAAENRQVRHRMFAVVDRTNLTLDPNNPRVPGPRAFFLDVLTPVNAPGAQTITISTVTGAYEDSQFTIRAGDRLTIDSGPNQEVITVTAANIAARTITANFTKTHGTVGVLITNAGGQTVLGNPGPQPRFEARHPQYSGVVRFANILK